MTRYTWTLVWMIMLYAAQFLTSAAWLQSEASVLHHHEEITKRMIQVGRGSEFLLQQDSFMGDDDGIIQISKKTNRRCRRCLQMRQEEDELMAAPTPDKSADGDQAVVDPPMAVDLPTLPTDPEASTLMPPRTNPSSLLSPGVTSLVNHNSNSRARGLSSSLGISASVGATAGVAVLIVGLLYYFKPDIFLCCKTCVRVQVFHHTNHASKP